MTCPWVSRLDHRAPLGLVGSGPATMCSHDPTLGPAAGALINYQFKRMTTVNQNYIEAANSFHSIQIILIFIHCKVKLDFFSFSFHFPVVLVVI